MCSRWSLRPNQPVDLLSKRPTKCLEVSVELGDKPSVALWTRGAATVALHFASFDDYWAPFELGQGPAGAHVAALPGDHRTELARRLRSRLLGASPDRPFDMQARTWAVKGTI